MYIVEKGTVPNKSTIEAAIKHNEKSRTRYNKLDDYYLGQHGITKRVKVEALKNNQIVVNHAKYITNTNVGYLLGNPVEYQALRDGINLDPVLDQYKLQTIPNTDNIIAKDLSKFGKAYEYTYAFDNDVHSKVIDVRNCVVVYDNTMEREKLFAVLYAKADAGKYSNVSVLDSQFVTTYDEELKETGKTPHAFGHVPLVEYSNNEEQTGDYEDVLSLIDAYNVLQSDRINDKEQWVESILMLYGFGLDDKQVKTARSNRILSVPKDAKAEYLVKQLQEADADVLRLAIEKDIHKISMTPNLSDDNFVGNSSGVAIEYKLIHFNQNIMNKERSFEVGLKERFGLYNNYLRALNKSQEIPIYEIDVVFKRNLPRNDYETSQMISNLSGIVSNETLVAQLSFVEDAEGEAKWAADEAKKRAQALAGRFGTNSNDGEEDAE